MASKPPKMDEQQLLLHLRDCASPITPMAMRQICCMVVLDCWDRNLLRPFFASILDLCMEIDVLLAAMEKGGALRYVIGLIDEEREPAMLDEQLNGIVMQFMRKRQQLAEKFALVCQCPGHGDTIS